MFSVQKAKVFKFSLFVTKIVLSLPLLDFPSRFANFYKCSNSCLTRMRIPVCNILTLHSPKICLQSKVQWLFARPTDVQNIKQLIIFIKYFKYEVDLFFCDISLCVKSTHIGSLFCLTSQSVGISRMRTHTSKVYFVISFNRLRCQIAEKWATQF